MKVVIIWSIETDTARLFPVDETVVQRSVALEKPSRPGEPGREVTMSTPLRVVNSRPHHRICSIAATGDGYHIATRQVTTFNFRRRRSLRSNKLRFRLPEM